MNPTYQICYFGLLSERRSLAVETLSHPATNPSDLYQALDHKFCLGLKIPDLRTAVNDEFVPWDHPLKNNDQIAFLPPMSGGEAVSSHFQRFCRPRTGWRMLQCRVGSLTDGAVVGSRSLVDQRVELARCRFGPKRESGASDSSRHCDGDVGA